MMADPDDNSSFVVYKSSDANATSEVYTCVKYATDPNKGITYAQTETGEKLACLTVGFIAKVTVTAVKQKEDWRSVTAKKASPGGKRAKIFDF